MWEVREAQPLIKAAERAAEAGNYSSAENLLREAARQQEANLGPRHPDLANTLNNLGIVCEKTGKPEDAEQYFRRAVSIARTSLEPDHPFLATSQKNLRDFCESRGKKVEMSAPAPAPEPAPTPVPAPAPEPSKPEPEPTVTAVIDPAAEDPELASKKLFLRVALGALGPIAALMVVLAAGLPKLGAPELTPPARAVTLDSPPPVPVDASPAPEETSTTSTRTESEEAADHVVTADIPPAPKPATPAPPPARPVVVRASLCGDLEDWACDPADRPVPPGPLFFYTQIKSTSATTVQHRWYQDNRLHHTVELRVQANRTAGYRTYSRNLMTSESAGKWRIELRSEDGALLHEERFTVH
jgi:hypothetical protein